MMEHLRAYDAILFDVGGTLINVVRDPHEMALETVAHLGTAPLHAFRDGLQQAIAAWQAGGGAPHEEDLAATWTRHYQRALSLAGFTGDCVLGGEIMEAQFITSGWEVIPDALPLLERLREAGHTLGVVSNWPPTLVDTLERAGLKAYFKTIISSGDVGYAKPRPEIFAAALDALEVDPRGALYVGDSVTHDVEGATRAGLTAVLVDRADKYPAHRPRIRALTELMTPWA